MARMSNHSITARQIAAARRAFKAREPRDLFYRAATELVTLALRGSTSLSLAEALAVLLQTWNKAYYQYRPFNLRHLDRIERLLAKHATALSRYRRARLHTLNERQKLAVSALFEEFERALGPVGAAKALHLLAPRMFPIWDRTIADAYDLSLGKAGTNGNLYWDFMLIARNQCLRLMNAPGFATNPLKAIDEYNYCKHTQGWL